MTGRGGFAPEAAPVPDAGFRWGLPLLLAAGSFALSAILIHRHPPMYWSDPYGRVIGRDHILVDRWLPLLQIVVFLVGRVTKSIAVLRLVLAGLSAATVVASAALGTRLFTHSVGLLFAALLATNALFVALATVPYQEVLFLGLIFAGLFFHKQPGDRRQRWLALVAINLACLTRYEGWILVSALVAVELVETTIQSGIGRGMRSAAGLAGRYGAAALGWLLFALVLSPRTTLLHRPAPAERITTFVHQIRWQTGNAWLFPLAGLGLALSLIGAGRRRSHLVILIFLIGDLGLTFLANPYSPGNLRATFLPVVFVLFYAAVGLQLGLDRALVRPLFGGQPKAGLAVTVVAVAAIAIFFVPGATHFVAESSSELEFRVPFEVARYLETTPVELRKQLRVTTLGDDYVGRMVLAAYSRIPFDRINPLVGDLPADATHVVDLQRPGATLSSAAQDVKNRLGDGRIPAQAVRLESAVVWTLQPGSKLW